MSNLFRDKSMKRISSPDQMDDYIRVTTPSVWIALLALVILLIGILAWTVLGTMEVHDQDGTPTAVHPISYVTN